MDIQLKKSRCKENIKRKALDLGFAACGFARVDFVGTASKSFYDSWIETGKHGEMTYMERYREIRENPVMLFETAKTIISVALNYYPQKLQPDDVPQFAYYAYGKDYHDVIRSKLLILSEFIEKEYGFKSRVCVDTAPLRERYWAQQSGIGFIGINNQLILPGKGSYFFLGELISELDVEPDLPCHKACGACRRCVDSCPTKALSGIGALDARKCISAVTIEYRGEKLPGEVAHNIGNRVYGCDICQQVCPHNSMAEASEIEEFTPQPEFLNLDSEALDNMTVEQFKSIFRKSAVKRVKLSMLKRNLNAIRNNKKE